MSKEPHKPISMVDLAATYASDTLTGSVPALRRAAEVAETLPRGDWLLRPYLERKSIAVMFGDYGTLKSFIAIDWYLRTAIGITAIGENYRREPEPAILISAEGRGLAKRLRAWCRRNYPDRDMVDVLAKAQAYVIEQAVNLSDLATVMTLRERIRSLGIRPSLIVIDTLSRNSNGAVESSTADAAAYLALIDQELRAVYGCCVLLVHHVGHTEKGRIRGPIVLAANTDTLIRVERPDVNRLDVRLTVERLKDCEPPPPASLRGAVIDLGEADEDGRPITSLAIEGSPTDVIVQRRPTGKNQERLLSGIREWRREHDGADLVSSDDLRQIGEGQGIRYRNRLREAIDGLQSLGYLVPSVGGFRVVDTQSESRSAG